MRKCIPNRELDELGDGLVRSFLKKSGIRRLPKCVDIEGLANSLGLTVIFEEFAEDDYDKIGFLADGKTPLKIKRVGKIVSFLFPLGTIVADSRLRRDSESGKFRFEVWDNHILYRWSDLLRRFFICFKGCHLLL